MKLLYDLTSAITIILISYFAVSCREQTPCNKFTVDININENNIDSIISVLDKEPDNLKLANTIWVYLSTSGQDSKVVEHAKKMYAYYTEKGNVENATWAATYVALPYVALNEFDSARVYLDYVAQNASTDSPVYAMTQNAEAVYAYKSEMDYPKALGHLFNALEYYRKKHIPESESIVLGNIAILYSKRNDTTGLKYAQRAYEIADSIKNLYSICFSLSSLTQLEYQAGHLEDAELHILKADSIIKRNPYLNLFLPVIYDTYSNVAIAEKNYRKAGELIELTNEYLKYNQDDIYSELCHTKAIYYYETGDYVNAEKYYHEALKLSEENNSSDLLLGLSKTYGKLGMKDSALVYYQKYHQVSNNVFGIDKENQFNQLFLDYEKVKYQNSLQEKELRLVKSKRTNTIIFFALVIIAVILIALYTIYRKKNRMYLTLVEQHQNLIRQKQINEENMTQRAERSSESKTEKVESDIYERLERLMKEDKIYRINDISLDKLAEMLDTNRTYISNVINKHAGMSFPNYINSYRINDAISVISDPDREVVLKAVCDEIGYNSLTSFYRAFQKETGCTPMIYRKKILELHNKK